MPSTEDYVADLKSGDFDKRKRAASRLADAGTARAIEPLIEVLNDPDWSIRASAVIALGHIYVRSTKAAALDTKRIMNAILPLIESEQPGLRIAVIRVLGWLGDVRAADPIMAALDDQDKDVREEAIQALGKMGDSRVVDRFLKTAQGTSAEKWTRVSAIGALGNLHNKQTIEPLITLLKDDLPEIRSSAIYALMQLNDRQAVEPVRALLEDPVDSVRATAVEAAIHFADAEAIPRLQWMAKNDDGWGNGQFMRTMAAKAARLIKGKQPGAARDPITKIVAGVKGLGGMVLRLLRSSEKRKASGGK